MNDRNLTISGDGTSLNDAKIDTRMSLSNEFVEHGHVFKFEANFIAWNSWLADFENTVIDLQPVTNCNVSFI